MIDRDIERKIKDSVDILHLCNVYGIEARKKGINYFCRCPNPSHEDKTPSCSISPTKNIIKCFSCGWSADGVGLVQMMENCNYLEALRKLADIYHIEIKENEGFKIPKFNPNRVRIEAQKPKPTHIEAEKADNSLNNSLVRWLYTIADKESVNTVCNLYRIGSKNESPVFWYINKDGDIVDGKVMQYNTDGHRKKDKSPYYLHGRLEPNTERDNLPLFGEHLINLPEYKDFPIAIVESEKTALICSIYEPFFLWLATGGKTNGTANIKDKFLPLRGRNIFVYPDADALELWGGIVKRLYFAYNIELVTDWMKHATPEDGEKYDIADIMVKYYQD